MTKPATPLSELGSGRGAPELAASCAYRFGGEVVASAVRLTGLREAGPGGPAATVTVVRSRAAPSRGGWRPIGDNGNGAVARIRCWTSDEPPVRHRLGYAYRDHRADFVLAADGSAVSVWATAGVGDDDLARLIEGPILGRALRLAGRPCLHATTLVRGGRAVAVAGDGGAGKSTLAAALIAAGCGLFGDDLARVVPLGDGLGVHRGQARLRLWPGADAPTGRPIWAGIAEMTKRIVDLPTPSGPDLIPLHAVYVLAPRRPGGGTAVDRLAAVEALAALARNVYGSVAPSRAVRQEELAALARIAAAVPVCRLRCPDGQAALRQEAGALADRLFG